jgi:class I fructose-bisphosphate aldolase
MIDKIKELLGSEADSLLDYKAKFPKEKLHLPGPDFIDRIFINTDRNINVLKTFSGFINQEDLQVQVMFPYFL